MEGLPAEGVCVLPTSPSKEHTVPSGGRISDDFPITIMLGKLLYLGGTGGRQRCSGRSRIDHWVDAGGTPDCGILSKM